MLYPINRERSRRLSRGNDICIEPRRALYAIKDSISLDLRPRTTLAIESTAYRTRGIYENWNSVWYLVNGRYDGANFAINAIITRGLAAPFDGLIGVDSNQLR